MDFDELSPIAEQFISDNLEELLSVRTIHVTTAVFEGEGVYKVACIAQAEDRSARVMRGARVEVLTAKDG